MTTTVDRPLRARTSRLPTAVVLASYLGLALYVTWSWWTPLGGRITGVNDHDMALFSWLLSSTPHSLGTGRPFYTDLLNTPDGINLMWNNGMALPGLLFAPVTAVFGGLATVTVITTVGLAGTAATAFWALRCFGVGVGPAAFGGVIAGFSPAMTAQALGHPDLMFNVLVPVLLVLAVRVTTEEHVTQRVPVLLGAAAGAQVLIGEEVLFGTGIVVALLLLVLVLGHPRTARLRAPAAAGRAAVAFGVFVVVAGVPLGVQLFGPLPQQGSPFTTSYYTADLANYVVPTQLQAFASAASVERSVTFPGGLEERTAYLGWPLVALSLLTLLLMWRTTRVRTPLLVGFLMAVLAMGDELTIDGQRRGVPLPWALITDLPGFEHVLTSRFALFTAGLLGAGLAFALDDLARRPVPVRVAGLIGAVVVAVPLVPAPLPGTDAPGVPSFFTTGAARDLDCGSALILPFPGPLSTDPMLWQEASGMSFAMPGGYFIGPGADGRAYVGGQPTVTGTLFDDVRSDGQPRPVTPEVRDAFAADMTRWGACAVVLGPARNLDALREQATALIGREPEFADGVYLWRDVR